MNYTMKARFNRVVSDFRCAIGGALIRAGARITDAAVHSHRGRDCAWDWKMLVKREKHDAV